MKAPALALVQNLMGTPGLQDLGGRPQGRGCLLLVVAGVASLVTLLLAVPITVLAVLALVPQEQGGRVTETTGPGPEAQLGLQQGRPSCHLPSPSSSLSGTPGSHHPPQTPSSSGPAAAASSQPADVRGATLPPIIDSSPLPGVQQLPEEEEGLEADLSPQVPAAHLIGARRPGQRLGWEAREEAAFLRSGARFSEAGGLALPRAGVYYLYCHVGFRGRAPAGRGRSVTLRGALFRAGRAPGPPLLEGAETVTPPAGRAGPGPLWLAGVGFGGLVRLRGGEGCSSTSATPTWWTSGAGRPSLGP